MGTKLNPGKYDCYENAEPDEPMFVLLGRDRLAGHLVSIWAKIRMGDMEAASFVFMDMLNRHGVAYGLQPDIDPALEAVDCAFEMFKYHRKLERARHK